MAATTKMVPIARSFMVQPGGPLSPEIAAQEVAASHRAQVADAVRIDTEVTGAAPAQSTFVNGVPSDDLARVRPGQAIVTLLELASDMLTYIHDLLIVASPHRTGAFQRSITIYADGVEVDSPDAANGAEEVVFTSTAPYARKIERGESDQAPDGVFEGVAALAKQRYGNQADIRFSYRNPVGGGTALDQWAQGRAATARRPRQQHQRDTRQPAIVVTFK